VTNDKKKYCIGCDNHFYNDNNPMGIRQCWHLPDAKMQTRYCIGVNTPQDKVSNFIKIRTLGCFTESGYAYYDELPSHLK